LADAAGLAATGRTADALATTLRLATALVLFMERAMLKIGGGRG